MIKDSPPPDTVLRSRDPSARSRKSLLIETAIVVALVLLMIYVMPGLLIAMGQGFRIGLLGRFMALAIAALGIDLIWGYTGILSLGHGAFFALGGYSIAMYLQLQLPNGAIPEFFSLYGVKQLPVFWQPFYSLPFTIFAVFVIPTVVGGILGYLVFRNRLKGVYFSILTQAALLVFFNFFNGQQKLINGTNGLTTDTTQFFGQVVGQPLVQWWFYIASAIFLALSYALCRWLTSGRLGKLLIAIRDDESRLRFSGYNPTAFKVLVFAVSAGLAGIAGALYSVQSNGITPKAMDVAFSIEMVIWVAVGGRSTLIGAVFGAIVVNYAKSILSEQFPAVWLFFQGALFLIVVTVLPSGVVGWFQQQGMELIRSRFGKTRLSTYPGLELNPDVQYERQIYEPDSAPPNPGNRESDG
jgi:urea transport system permease protein